MADTTLNQFVGSGTAAEMAAFTPTPPSPANAPPHPGYTFFNTDDGILYSWDGANWVAPAGSGTVTNTGTLTANQIIKGNGGVDITVGDLSGDVTTSGTMATTIANNAVTTVKILDANVTLAKIANAANNSRILGSGSGGSGAAYTELTAGSGVSIGASSVALSTAALTRAITFAIDGGGSALTTGVKADISVPYACTITSVVMLADQSGSVVVDIWKDTLANYPPTVADTITASAKPTITTATNSSDTTLTGWTTSITAGDTLRFNIDSATTITRLSLTLKVTVS